MRTFQRTSVFRDNSVFENVLIGLHLRGRATVLDTLLRLPRERQSEAELTREAWSVLELVGLKRHAHELAGALPYGDQRLLGVALALAAQPSMLLLDEPVSGMNASETAGFMQLLGNIRARGITILLVEHDMPMVMGVSDRIVVLNYGRIIAEGSPSEIRDNPDVIPAYLGQGAAPAMLELRNLVCCYGNVAAVKGVSLSVKKGQLVAFIGANGAGKTTMLRSISGLLQPSRGKFIFEGEDITLVSPRKFSSAASPMLRKGAGSSRT